jgi:hypothetical protein
MEFWSLQLVLNGRQARHRTAPVGPQGVADRLVVGSAPRRRLLAAVMSPFRRRQNRIGDVIIDLKDDGEASDVRAAASADHAEQALVDAETSMWSRMGAGGQ